MRKSEMVREAGKASQAHKDSQRYCYCTPSRAMLMSVRNVCLNQNVPNPQEIADEISERVAEQMRTLTGRERYREDLQDFDTVDSSAAYALWHRGDEVVQKCFEEAAKTYEAEEIAAWDAAKAAWEESVRAAAAKTPVRRKAAQPLDPARKRNKAGAKAQKSAVRAETQAPE